MQTKHVEVLENSLVPPHFLSYLKETKPPPQQTRKKISKCKKPCKHDIFGTLLFDDENHYPQLSVMKAENVH